MKKIGKGWQYTVFDVGNNRVRKIFNTRNQSVFTMFISCFPYIKHPLWKFFKYYRSVREKAKKSISFVRQSNLNMGLFGNPHFINDLDYEQDKVTSLYEYLKNISTKDGEIIIDRFITFNNLLIENGISEESFKFTKNFGIDENENINFN